MCEYVYYMYVGADMVLEVKFSLNTVRSTQADYVKDRFRISNSLGVHIITSSVGDVYIFQMFLKR